VVFVTHSIDEAVTVSDRVVVLSARPGRIVDEVAISLPRPRAADVVDSDRFVAHTRRLRAALRTAHDPVPRLDERGSGRSVAAEDLR